MAFVDYSRKESTVKRGPKPKPLALKKLQGNPGGRPLNEHEPRPDPGVPGCPRVLTGEAKREWRRVSKLLLGLDLMTHMDRAALTLYCQAWGDWITARQEIASRGLTVPKFRRMENDQDEGEPAELVEYIVNPAVGIAERAAKQMTRLLAEFGLTPSSRTRLSGPTRESDEADPFADLFRRAQKGGKN